MAHAHVLEAVAHDDDGSFGVLASSTLGNNTCVGGRIRERACVSVCVCVCVGEIIRERACVGNNT